MPSHRSPLDYPFGEEKLLVQALTHSSAVNEERSSDEGSPHNGRLEFLGDAILGLLIAQFLFEAYPQTSAGDLTAMRAYLASRKVLAAMAAQLRLGDHLRLGKGEEASKGRRKESILAGALEALIAALYLDGGWPAVYECILPHFRRHLEEAPPASLLDPKSRLQTLVQLRYGILPQYEITEKQGPPHEPTFQVEVKAGEAILGRGEGRSKREAEQEAARLVLGTWEGGEGG